MKPTDQQMIVTERTLCSFSFSGWKGHMEAHGLVRRQREREELWARTFTAVSVKRVGSGRVNGFRTD